MQDGSYIRVPLRSRTGTVRAYALLDERDARLAEHRWYLDPNGYAQRYIGTFDGKQRLIGMHRAVLGLTYGDGLQGDHINGDRLDNRRSNLRVVTIAQNRQNVAARGTSSRYRGVGWSKFAKKWRAFARVSGRMVHLGYFTDEEDAAAAAADFREAHMTHAVNR